MAEKIPNLQKLFIPNVLKEFTNLLETPLDKLNLKIKGLEEKDIKNKTTKDILGWTKERINQFKEIAEKKLSLVKAYDEIEKLTPCGKFFIQFVYFKILSQLFPEKVQLVFRNQIEKYQQAFKKIEDGIYLLDTPNGNFLFVEDGGRLPFINFGRLSNLQKIFLIIPCSSQGLIEFLKKGTSQVSDLKIEDKDISFWANLFIRGVQEKWGDIFLSAQGDKYVVKVRNKVGKIEFINEFPKEQIIPEIRKLLVWTRSKAETLLELNVAIDASLNYVPPSVLAKNPERNESLLKLFKLMQDFKAEADFRIAIAPTVFGKAAAVRILPKNREIKGITELGYSEDKVNRILSLVRLKQGLITVSGPTGSGKSTLLYAIVKRFVEDGRRVMSVEDPVEATIPGVDQVQVTLPVYDEKGNLIGIDFALAIRNFLRQNPDVIVVGETRDTETAEKVLEASNTGHLVLTTIHANDEFSTIRRLVELAKKEGTSEEVVIETTISQLKAVVAQRLVRTLCPRCKAEGRIKKVVINDEILQSFPASVSQYLMKIKGEEVYLDPDPNNTCGECLNGYAERKPVVGILEMNQHLQDYLIERKMQITRKDLIREAKKDFSSMIDDALEKLKAGEIGLYTFAEIV
jgi:Tfp pilus assembly pilus retraction ATPase PilT